jgi:UDP-N-acetylmuramoyl-tripeptide--D-alanyl-D-alanine ligase
VGRVHASDKSYNNHWGVPLSLARLPRDADYAVFEIGMNHPGEITPLTQLVRPHLAIITTVAPVHMEFFAGIEDIAEAKAEIFLGLDGGGAAILNRDNAQFGLLAERAKERGAGRIVGFGGGSSAEARLVTVEGGDGGSLIEADILGEPVTYELGAPGDHLAMNSLAALAAVKLAGGNIETAASALAGFGAPQGRGAQSVHRITGGQFLLIDESYNANPASVGAALKVLGDVPPTRATRRIAVLGDMLELGSQSEAMHAALADHIKAARIDLVYCCGPHMEALFDALDDAQQAGWSEDSDGLRDTLPAAIRAGDAIMIKGSLGSRMGPLVNAIKDRFPPLRSADRTAAE